MSPKESPGAVFDCNIFFQATRDANGPAAKTLTLLETGAFSLFVSGPILEEVKETLTDPAIRAKNPSLTDEVVEALLEHLRSKATLIHEVPEQFSFHRDPDDAKYVNLALAAEAKYRVTCDKDLLDLMKDEAFCKQFPQLTILDPVAFLRELDRVTRPRQ